MYAECHEPSERKGKKTILFEWEWALALRGKNERISLWLSGSMLLDLCVRRTIFHIHFVNSSEYTNAYGRLEKRFFFRSLGFLPSSVHTHTQTYRERHTITRGRKRKKYVKIPKKNPPCFSVIFVSAWWKSRKLSRYAEFKKTSCTSALDAFHGQSFPNLC